MRARVILVQNPETKTWFPKRHRHRIVVFPNPILDVDAPAQRTRRAGKTAVFAGRLLPTKGAEVAVRAVASTPDWRLLVCGGGIGEGRLRRLVRQLALEERVLVLGPQRRERLFETLRSADVLLYPSLREDAGWIVVEALACGLPVICVDRGGPPVLAGQAGLLVARSGDIDAIAAALGERLAGSTLPPPDVLRARATHFSSERTCQRLRRLLAATGLVPSTPS
jgi:glycosyltransferase involved in cell wall biosynthesis